MKDRRTDVYHTMKHHHSLSIWRMVLLGGLLIVFLALSGCAPGAARHQSWTGLLSFEGTLYMSNLERVQAFNAETGKSLWSYPEESTRNGAGLFYSTPVLAPDHGEYGLLLVAGFNDRTVHALRLGSSPAERPDVAWQFTAAQGQYVGNGTIAGDLFLIGNGDGNVYALPLGDGTEQAWSFATQDRVWAAPVVHDDVVFVASLDHHVYALNLADGEEIWRLETKGSVAATPVFLNDYLWVGDFGKTLYKVDPETGTIVWEYETSGWLWGMPIVDGSILYFADVDGYVYALDTETEQMIWSEPAFVDDVVRAQPALNPDRTLLFIAGYEKGQIHALDTETGAKMSWGQVFTNPGRLPGDLVTDDEHLYLLPILIGERLQTLDIQDGKLLWAYPPSDE